jgi:hypothetical protein
MVSWYAKWRGVCFLFGYLDYVNGSDYNNYIGINFPNCGKEPGS